MKEVSHVRTDNETNRAHAGDSSRSTHALKLHVVRNGSLPTRIRGRGGVDGSSTDSTLALK
jgi:hypothetical protein